MLKKKQPKELYGRSPAMVVLPAIKKYNALPPEERAKASAQFIKDTLNDRGECYGDFTTHAELAQTLKNELQNSAGWGDLTFVQAEALEMIMVKVARILNGDPNYADSWHDIAGYATLAEERCKPT